jgi:release factor glutamine methyltransferase
LRRLAARVEALRPYHAPPFERVLGLDLWIPPTVLPPARFRVGVLLARAVADAVVAPETRILDVGTGSGIVGLAAARAGARVTAVDINPAAVRAATVNAMLNRLTIDAREGDLFAPLRAEERFEIIAFNPPFFENEVGGELRTALSDRPGLPTLARFLEGARAFLAPGGALLLAGSSHGALGRMRSLYAEHGYTYRTVRTKERISERLVIDRLTC